MHVPQISVIESSLFINSWHFFVNFGDIFRLFSGSVRDSRSPYSLLVHLVSRVASQLRPFPLQGSAQRFQLERPWNVTLPVGGIRTSVPRRSHLAHLEERRVSRREVVRRRTMCTKLWKLVTKSMLFVACSCWLSTEDSMELSFAIPVVFLCLVSCISPCTTTF